MVLQESVDFLNNLRSGLTKGSGGKSAMEHERAGRASAEAHVSGDLLPLQQGDILDQ